MIVVELSYKVEPDVIAALRPAHLEWLKEGLASGRLLLAGRKMPITGGMLLVNGTLEEAQAFCAEDPFAKEGASDYRFFEYAPTMAAPGLEALLV